MMPDQTIEVRDDPDRQRYVIIVDGTQRGLSEYRRRGDTRVFTHTEIDDEVSGRGLASRLVQEAVDDVRARGGMIVPLCPFLGAWLDRHPEHRDLVDDELASHYRRG